MKKFNHKKFYLLPLPSLVALGGGIRAPQNQENITELFKKMPQNMPFVCAHKNYSGQSYISWRFTPSLISGAGGDQMANVYHTHVEEGSIFKNRPLGASAKPSTLTCKHQKELPPPEGKEGVPGHFFHNFIFEGDQETLPRAVGTEELKNGELENLTYPLDTIPNHRFACFEEGRKEPVLNLWYFAPPQKTKRVELENGQMGNTYGNQKTLMLVKTKTTKGFGNLSFPLLPGSEGEQISIELPVECTFVLSHSTKDPKKN